MSPISPVVPGFEAHEKTFAENQPQYQNLPAIKCNDGQVFTRWRLNWRERLRVLVKGDVFLAVHTFNQPLQPVLLTVEAPQFEQQTTPSVNSSASLNWGAE